MSSSEPREAWNILDGRRRRAHSMRRAAVRKRRTTSIDEDGFEKGTQKASFFKQVKPHADDMGIEIFITEFIQTHHWMHFIDYAQLRVNGPASSYKERQGVVEGMQACGLALMTSHQDSATADKRARLLYAQALRRVHKALESPALRCGDETILTVMLLATFESLMPTNSSLTRIKNWKSHAFGSVRLLETRGIGALATPIGMTAFISIRPSILLACIWDCCEVPQFLLDWPRTLLWHSLSPQRQHAESNYDIASSYANLRMTMISAKSSRDMYECYSEACALERKMIEWEAGALMYEEWTYNEGNATVSIDTWSQPTHVYKSPLITSVWNVYRMLRVMLSQTLLLLTSWTGSEQRFADERQRLANDVCASIPFALRYSDTSTTANRPVLIHTFAIVWPLFYAGQAVVSILSGSPVPSPEQQETSFAQLEWILQHLKFSWTKAGAQYAKDAFLGLQRAVNATRVLLERMNDMPGTSTPARSQPDSLRRVSEDESSFSGARYRDLIAQDTYWLSRQDE